MICPDCTQPIESTCPRCERIRFALTLKKIAVELNDPTWPGPLIDPDFRFPEPETEPNTFGERIEP